MGLQIFSDEEYIENNCTECDHFISYYEDYGYDDLEPIDQGFCRELQNDNYGDATITCNFFKKREYI